MSNETNGRLVETAAPGTAPPMTTNGVHIGTAIPYGEPHGKVGHKCLNHAAGQKAKLAKAFPMGAGRFLIWAVIPYADQWAPDGNVILYVDQWAPYKICHSQCNANC